jgi:aldehyde dehydrogenase
MSLSSVEIDQIVKTVIEELKKNGSVPTPSEGLTGIFPTLDEAYRAAKESQKHLHNLEMRKKIILAIRTASLQHASELAKMAVEETGFGRVEDKIKKNLAQAEMTPGVEDLQP